MSEMRDTVRMLSLVMQAGLHNTGIRIPFILMGKSGIGKTVGLNGICKSLERALNMQFVAEVYSAPQLQAEDIGGMPVPNYDKRRTELWPLRVGDKVDAARSAGGSGLIALDEFGSITNAQEATFLNLLQGGTLGEKTLDTSIALGAMGNPVDIASNGREMSGPAANRFVWFDWDLPYDVWCNYMEGGVGFGAYVEVLPPDWKKLIPENKARIASYIKRHPDQLHNAPPPRKSGKAWPSPRSWETAAYMSAMVQAVGSKKTSDLASTAITACVGMDAATLYTDWLVDMNLPDPEELLADPENAPKLFPSRRDQLTVAMENMAAVAVQGKHERTPEEIAARWSAAWKILGPVFTEFNDVGINAAKTLAVAGVPPGASFPPEAVMIRDILTRAGLLAS